METLMLTAIRFGLDVTLKATLLLALVLCLVAALRRASAAFRHLAAALGLAGVLALPFATLIVPRVAVSLVPNFLPATPSASRIAVPARTGPKAIRASFTPSNTPGACPGVPAPAGPAWPGWAITIWGAGALLLSLRLLSGSLRARGIARRGERLLDSECLEEAGEISRRLGLKSPVRMVTSAEVPVAMTAGVFRPVLLLNSSARQWPSDLRRAVLLHELAHVRRGDWITFLLGELAVGLYWFHPLAWLVRRQARSNAERACDDRVIGEGTKPSAYAAQLLDVVRSFASDARGTLPVMAMARPSEFEGRVRAILDPDLGRRETSGRVVHGAAFGFLASIIALASLAPRTALVAEPLEIAPVPLAAALPSAAPASVQQPPTKAECEIRPGKAAAKSKCRRKAARSSSHPSVSA